MTGRLGPIVLRSFTLGLVLCALAASKAVSDQAGGYSGFAVSVFKADRRCFKDDVLVSGVLAPKAEIKVWPERAGPQISQVLVEPGDSVGQGQVLARLVDPYGAPPQNGAIKAPVSGLVVGVSAIVGSYVSPTAQAPLFRIVVDGELELRGEVLAPVLPKLQRGQAAALQVAGFEPLDGRVTSVDAAIDPVSQLGSVHITFAPDPRLRPGAFARADIDAGQKCAVTVPLSAVMYGPEGEVVQVVKGDHVETRRVDVGLLQNGLIQIQQGVDQGDVVIERAGSFLREGDRVRPVPSPSPPGH